MFFSLPLVIGHSGLESFFVVVRTTMYIPVHGLKQVLPVRNHDEKVNDIISEEILIFDMLKGKCLNFFIKQMTAL